MACDGHSSGHVTCMWMMPSSSDFFPCPPSPWPTISVDEISGSAKLMFQGTQRRKTIIYGTMWRETPCLFHCVPCPVWGGNLHPDISVTVKVLTTVNPVCGRAFIKMLYRILSSSLMDNCTSLRSRELGNQLTMYIWSLELDILLLPLLHEIQLCGHWLRMV